MSSQSDRWIRWTTTGCVALLAMNAGTVSYLHIAQTAQAQSVIAPPGSAFCIVEPGNIIAGVFVKSVVTGQVSAIRM